MKYKLLRVRINYKGLYKNIKFKEYVEDIEAYRKELKEEHKGYINSLIDKFSTTKPMILIDYEEIEKTD